MRAVLIAILTLASGAAFAQERLALIVGQNDGGPGRTVLKFAEADAERFADVLVRLGGVQPDGLSLVLGPDASGFGAAIGRLSAEAKRAQDAGRRVEVIVYYSGHADDQGLLLAGDRVGFKDLRAQLTELPADVRIAVIDACAAGALTRAKGGVHVPPFLVDEASEMQGHAFLTAASETESAQESDHLQGSFFTHALVTGMRGAADVSGDGQVTLDEAYRFAFDETLQRTERSRIGPQHPGFDIQLTGQGELVMTDLRTASATLVLASALEGRVFLRDGAGSLALEVRKAPGRAITLGLEPGDYAATVARGEERSGANLSLTEGSVVELTPGMLARVDTDAAVVARGGPLEPVGPRIVTANVSLIPLLSINDVAGGPQINVFSFDVLLGYTRELRGLSLGFGVGWVLENTYGIQSSIAGTVTGGDVYGAQLSVGANVAGGDVVGLQMGVGANVAAGDVTVGQAAVGSNIVAGHLRGAQLGVGFNYATRVTGAQIALVNFTPQVQGAQVGLLNLAGHVKGAQVGLVNLAVENDGVAVGLLGGALNGYNHLSLYASGLAPVNVSGSFGSKFVYTLLSAGHQPLALGGAITSGSYSFVTLGLGGHVPLGDYFVDVDLSGGSVFPGFSIGADGNAILGVGRAVVGWHPDGSVGIFGGLSANTLVGIQRDVSIIGIGAPVAEGQGRVAVWPGAFIGARL